MRDLLPSLLCATAIATIGCGGTKSGTAGDDDGNPDVPAPIAGGGVGGGAIVDTAFIHVIDDVTRDPIPGANVLIGNYAGATDGDGLVIATGLVAGKQQLTVAAPGYRAEMWLGVNGQNLTVDLHVAAPLATNTATVSGSVDFGAVELAHTRTATVMCSETDDLSDPANNLTQPQASGNSCNVFGVAPGTSQAVCSFSMVCRQGSIALLARIADTTDVTITDPEISYAYLAPTMIMGDTANLVLEPVTHMTTDQVEVAMPPPGLATNEAIIGLELSNGDLFQLRSAPINSTVTSAILPTLADIDATATRLTSIASNGGANGNDPLGAVTLLRHQTGNNLAAPAYLAPPATAMAMTTGATWSSVAGATLEQVEYSDPTDGTTLLGATSFDGSTSFTLPTLPDLVIPANATAVAQSLFASGLDLTDFGLDADGVKLTAVGVHQTVAR